MAGFSAFQPALLQCAAPYNPLMPMGSTSFGATSRARTAPMEPSTRTQQPIVTGTGVLGLKFKDGVLVAADTLGSYGTLARFRDIRRIEKMGENTIIGGSGDISDLAMINQYVKELITYDNAHEDGCTLTPKDIHQYLGRVMYNRRNKFDPLWNELVVAGYRDGKPYLGVVDLIGTIYEDDVVATGFGNYICLPLLRKASTDLSREEASKVLEDCMRVLYYRNCKSTSRIQIAAVTAAGVEIGEPYEVSTYWGYDAFKNTQYHGIKN